MAVVHSGNVSGVDNFSFPGLRCKSWSKAEGSEVRVGHSSCVTSVDLVTLLPGVAGWLIHYSFVTMTRNSELPE